MTEQTERLFQKQQADGCIEVLENKPLRRLCIDGIEQTRIDLEHPERLASLVHRSLLACLLFIKTPETVLLGGLGGGAVARYLHKRQAEILGDAVEINETIAMLAKQYFYFPEQHWNLIVGDIQSWNKQVYDLIIIDIADGDLTPPWLTSKPMLSQLQGQLSDQGVLAIDLLVDDAQSFTLALSRIRKVFKQKTLCLSVPDHKNVIIFAFKQPPQNCSVQTLAAAVADLTKLWGLEFSVFIEQLKKDNPEGSGVF